MIRLSGHRFAPFPERKEKEDGIRWEEIQEKDEKKAGKLKIVKNKSESVFCDSHPAGREYEKE